MILKYSDVRRISQVQSSGRARAKITWDEERGSVRVLAEVHTSDYE